MNKKYLIDTHILLWLHTEPEKLPARILGVLENENTEIVVSIVSLWEITIKHSLGKLELDVSLQELYNLTIEAGISILSVEFPNLLILDNLPFHHDDPFDRLIITQALTYNLPVISKDAKFKLYNIQVVW